jgi:hypothetical protein
VVLDNPDPDAVQLAFYRNFMVEQS